MGRPRMVRARKLIASENQEQRALVKWIKMQRHLCDFIIKLNNEGARTCAQGWNLKLMGMCVGASDLFLAVPTVRHCGLWLEVKQNRIYTLSERARPSWVAQEIFIRMMKTVGYDGHFCYGFENGKEIIENYLTA